MKATNHSFAKGTALFVTGGITGATIALLFAPQSGKKTRRYIERAGENLLECAEEFREEVNERLEELVEQAGRMADRGWDKGEAIGHKLREDVLPRLESVRQAINQQIERAAHILHR